MMNWGNASKTCASIPQDTAEHNRRELVAFCQAGVLALARFPAQQRNNSNAEANDQAQNRRT